MCPRCGERVLVPSLDDNDDNLLGDAPPAAQGVASWPVICKLCGSRFYARPDQVGQILRCPDCHTENTVVEAAAAPPAIVPEALSDEDDFKLSEPVETPRYRALAADALEFERAIRGGFAAPAHPTNDTPAGQPPASAAPASPVPAAPATKAAASSPPVATPASTTPADNFELFPEDRAPAATSKSTSPAAGARRAEAPDLQPAFDDDDNAPFEPKLSEVVERPRHRPVVQLPPPDDNDDGSDFAKSVRAFLPQGPARPLSAELASRRPFSGGILSVLQQFSVMVRWLGLALLMLLSLLAMQMVDAALAAEGYAQVVAFFLFMIAFVPMLLGLLVMAVFCLTVFQDTANGNDRIEGWLRFSPFEWAGASVYFLAAMFGAGLPGAITSAVLTTFVPSPLLSLLLILPSLFLLFPLFFISMLEAGTVAEPLSGNMIKSFVPLARFWRTFYLLTFLLGLVGLVLNWFTYLWPPVTLVIGAVLFAALPFLYFRLLGRMAMVYRDYVFATSEDDDA
jgi:hypothetical protein